MKEVEIEESWVAMTTKVMKNTTEAESTKSLISCWEMAMTYNASFFFWNSTGKGSCYLSNEETQICATESRCPQNEKIQVPSEGSITVRTNNCTEIDFNTNQCQNLKVFLFKDPIYKCALLNETNCIFYKRKVYNFWAEAWSSPWVKTCILLCSIYVLFGIPKIVHLYKKEGTSKLRRRNTFEMKTIRRVERNFSMIDEPITYSIEKSQFQAWYRSGLIPKGNEFEDLVHIDTEQHVLKFSTGYGSKHPALNR